MGGRSDLDRDLIRLRKPLLRESRFFFSSPSPSSWASEQRVDDLLHQSGHRNYCLNHEDKYHEDLADEREGDCCITSHVL